MVAGFAALLSQCAGTSKSSNKFASVVVSVHDQRLAIYDQSGRSTKTYPISTSKFGLSDKPGKFGTPLGVHEVVAKIGHGMPAGAVFKSRHWTGEIIKPDAPGRDPIVSRILWLRGLEAQNKNAYARCIYIHGTAEEKNIGKPVSYGCIRMKSKDVIDLFNRLPIGSHVTVVTSDLPLAIAPEPTATPTPDVPADQRPPIYLTPPPKQAERERPLLAALASPFGRRHAPAAEDTASTAPAPAPATTPAAVRPAPATASATPATTRPAAATPAPTVIYTAPTAASINGPSLNLRSKRLVAQKSS